MTSSSDIEVQIDQFSVRTGRIVADRKDLGDKFEPQDGPPRFDVHLGVFPGPDALRVNLNLTVDDVYARYDVVFAGEWIPAEDETMTYPDGDASAHKLALNSFATKVLAIAEAKVAELSRVIDCPPVNFPHQLDVKLSTAEPEEYRSANPQEEAMEEESTAG